LIKPAPSQYCPRFLSPDGSVLGGKSIGGAIFGRSLNGVHHFWRAPSWAEIAKAEAAEPSGQR